MQMTVSHVALLMVIICIGSFLSMLLLHFRCYFHRIHIHSCFSFGLYWISGPVWLSTLFYPDFIYMKGYFWIIFNVPGKNFVILRVSGWHINDKYCLNACMVFLLSFWFVWLGSNVVFILIVCTLYTFLSAFSYIVSMHYLLSMPLKNHVWIL